jgi:intraflagellar transport protein 52
LYTPNQGYKQFARRLKLGSANFRPVANKDEITSASLREASIFVLGAPREKFSVNEFDAMKKFVLGGGSMLVLMGEGGESKHNTNINYLLEEFGIAVNSDCVVRASVGHDCNALRCSVTRL